MNKLRVGAPDFVSVRPLVYGLVRNAHPAIELSYAAPGQLAELLEQGALDAALIPSIEFLRGTGRALLEGPALVAKTIQGSLLLTTTKPVEEVRRIAVDEHSRSPVAALRIVLSECFGVLPDLCVAKNPGNWQEQYDGMLLTGDRSLEHLAHNARSTGHIYNIAELWGNLTMVPLVIAVWAYNDKKHAAPLSRALIDSRNSGMQNLSELADGIAQTSPYESKFLYEHFINCWDYHFADMEWEGLRTMEEFALRYDLLQKQRRQRQPA